MSRVIFVLVHIHTVHVFLSSLLCCLFFCLLLNNHRLGNQAKCYTRTLCPCAELFIAALLATMPEVSCFSVGALGETNRATSSFIARLADLGSENPERFGCCHGKEQAQGVVASFLGRNLGRILLRGVVRARHVALKASVGLGDGIAHEAKTWCHGRQPTGNEFDAGTRPFMQPNVGSPF